MLARRVSSAEKWPPVAHQPGEVCSPMLPISVGQSRPTAITAAMNSRNGVPYRSHHRRWQRKSSQ